MATIGQPLTSPEVGWKRYDNNNALIKYDGVWQYTGNSSTFYNGDASYSTELGSKVKFVFKGTKIRLIGAKNGASGTIGSSNVSLMIDGVLESTLSYYNPTVIYQSLIYEKENLEDKIHYVELINNESNYLWFDAIDIDSDGELIRYDYFETSWDEPMRKFGVGWYGFDEESGNTYNKIDNLKWGLVTGTLRTQGWDGQGNAMRFNGTSDVMVQPLGNSVDMPSSGGVTIKLKFKTSGANSAYMYMLASLNSYSSQKGMTFAISPQGRFHVGWTNNTTGSYCFSMETSLTYSDEKWHDVFFSWDGLANSYVYLFIDDMSKPVCKVKASNNNNGHTYPNFNLGRMAGATTGWFKGEVDDFQVYSKALLPSDFDQKRLAIKATNGKNIVPYPDSPRIKEISNLDEQTLLNQGYFVNEIDSAIDREIDLTRATTEYEIASNSVTAQPIGKIFNIPIGDNFKTAFIEDNY